MSFRTPLADVQTVHSLLDKVWSETPSDIRNDYGIEKFEKFKRWYASQTKRARDPTEVVTALTHAIVSETPQTRYRCCGLLVSMVWYLGELLPSQVFDDLLRFIDRFEFILE